MLQFKIKQAIRNLMKNKLYSSLIIGGFAIGFTACILIVLFYNAEHNVNTHFSNYKNIYRLYDAKGNRSSLDYKLNAPLLANYPDVKEACPLEIVNFPMTIKDEETKDYTRIACLAVINNHFFDVFSVSIVDKLAGGNEKSGGGVEVCMN